LSVRFLLLRLLHLLTLPTFAFSPPSLFFHYSIIFVLSQGRTLMLQVAMPPFLINNDISKEYDLYRDFNMAVNSIGCIVLVVIVPILLTLFNPDII
jgi:hypothetical protein